MRWGQSFPVQRKQHAIKAQRYERGRYTLRDPSTKGEGGDTQPTRMEEAEARTHWPDLHPPASAPWGNQRLEKS